MVRVPRLAPGGNFVRIAALVAPLLVAACNQSSTAPADDGEKLVAATLQLLNADGKSLCVDNRTSGRSLAIFGAMQVAPAASRRPLAWHVAGPLRPPEALSTTALYRDNVGTETAHLRDPGNATAILSPSIQRQLDADATALARRGFSQNVLISPHWVPGVVARWWPLNRVAPHCIPSYALSNPIWSATHGYVSVQAEHWGTTYAFDRAPRGWKPAGQWTNWLY